MGARPKRNPKTGYDESTPHNNGNGNGGTARRYPGRGKAAITDIRIARIETVPMTAHEYADAVETLAVLIARYETNHPNETAPPGIAA